MLERIIQILSPLIILLAPVVMLIMAIAAMVRRLRTILVVKFTLHALTHFKLTEKQRNRLVDKLGDSVKDDEN